MGNSCRSNSDQVIIGVNGQVVNYIGKIVMKRLIAGPQDGYR